MERRCWVHCLVVAGAGASTTGADTKQASNGRYTFTLDPAASWTLWFKEMPLKVLMNAFCRRGLDAQKSHLSRIGPALPRTHRGCCGLHAWHHLLSGPCVVAFVSRPLLKRALKAFSLRPSFTLDDTACFPARHNMAPALLCHARLPAQECSRRIRSSGSPSVPMHPKSLAISACAFALTGSA